MAWMSFIALYLLRPDGRIQRRSCPCGRQSAAGSARVAQSSPTGAIPVKRSQPMSRTHLMPRPIRRAVAVSSDITSSDSCSAAAEIRAERYHRSTRPISLGDAVLITSAKPGRRIATADPDVLAVAKLEGLDTNRPARAGLNATSVPPVGLLCRSSSGKAGLDRSAAVRPYRDWRVGHHVKLAVCGSGVRADHR